MNRRRLGKTGLEVSEIGFGGIPVTRVEQEEAVGLIRRGFELGLNFFDTANMYGDSEAKMGLALAPFRDQAVIATKTAARDAKTAEAHLKQSLAALKTDRIDLYQAHNVSTQEDLDKLLAPEGAYGFMVRAREKGLIRHIGLSSHNPTIAQQAVETGLFETLQYPFNFLETGALDSLFPAAQGLDMGLIGMKPLGGGILEEARLCFGFLREYPQVIPIPGIQARAELEEIVGLYRQPPALTPGERAAMEAVKAELGDNFCRRCGYCLPCPEGIEIPFVLLFKSQMKRFAPDRVVEMNKERMARARECQECGQCLERCPYGLPIPDLIRETAESFEAFCQGQA